MNNSVDSWSRCAKEFPVSAVANEETQRVKEFHDSTMRPLNFKRLDFNNGYSSRNNGLVATDIALASLEQIERNERVAKWIEDGMCTPPISEQNTSYISSPLFLNTPKRSERLEEESFSVITEELERSPILKCRNKPEVESEKFAKSPKIGKRCKISRDRRSKFGSLGKRNINDTESSTPSDRSPLLGKGSNSSRKHRPRIKRKRLQDRADFDTKTLLCLLSNENRTESILGLPDEDKSRLKVQELKVLAANEIKEEITISQDIFDEEIITASPTPAGVVFGGLLPCKREIKEEFILPDLKPSPSLWTTNEYCPSPVIELALKTEEDPPELLKTKRNLVDSFIEDTEEFLLPQITDQRHTNKNRSEQDNKFLILDSEFSIEEGKFVTDTERIDYETSSENEKDHFDLKLEKISNKAKSDSDKTVSDIIEEPTTQEYLEPLKPAVIITLRSTSASPNLRRSVSAPSPKISESISSLDPISQQISFANISVETTPPQTQEFFTHVPELLDSVKKKKSRPKKGSLSARLQKLISGQVSCVRLWRHQMSRESALDRSSAPCATLLVAEAWIEYGKNMHRSTVVDDPYDLLNEYFDELPLQNEKVKRSRRNLVVMTNPDLVGSVKLLPGTVFKIYLPWQVFNRNSSKGNLILDVLYFNVVSDPGKWKLESDLSESGVLKNSSEIMKSEVTREYHCPCLANGKIDNSCSTKFSSCKIDIIDEIVK